MKKLSNYIVALLIATLLILLSSCKSEVVVEPVKQKYKIEQWVTFNQNITEYTATIDSMLILSSHAPIHYRRIEKYEEVITYKDTNQITLHTQIHIPVKDWYDEVIYRRDTIIPYMEDGGLDAICSEYNKAYETVVNIEVAEIFIKNCKKNR